MCHNEDQKKKPPLEAAQYSKFNILRTCNEPKRHMFLADLGMR